MRPMPDLSRTILKVFKGFFHFDFDSYLSFKNFTGLIHGVGWLVDKFDVGL